MMVDRAAPQRQRQRDDVSRARRLRLRLRLRLRRRLRSRVRVALAAVTLLAAILLASASRTSAMMEANGGVDRSLLSTAANSNYPSEALSDAAILRGGFVLYVVGILYMFAGIAIVADEFFVPSLDCITEDTGVSQDVAGATFMAAGGSAPELFTSFVGVFVSHSNVGIGTIVGSAVFNVLFVIGMCAVFSKEVLSLTWWPLFRDACFYTLDLVVLAFIFSDRVVSWQEALVLLALYALYVAFMSQNAKIHAVVRRLLARRRQGQRRLRPFRSSRAAKLLSRVWHMSSEARSNMGAFRFLFSTSRRIPATLGHHPHPHHTSPEPPKTAIKPNAVAPASVVTIVDAAGGGDDDLKTGDDKLVTVGAPSAPDPDHEPEEQKQKQEPEEEEETPFVVEWPEDRIGQFMFVLLAPLNYAMYYTNPDPRREGWRSFYPLTFVVSIVWIGLLSYHMVWWAESVGRVVGIPPEVMGVTVLAAGTSIPDLITSVIVARQGYGDMAVSSSIGSNIFDVTVGLPLPWLSYAAIYGENIRVDSNSLLSSVVILVIMLVAVISTVALSGWRMTKTLGGIMFLLYVLFLTQNLLIEAGYVNAIL